MSFFLSIFWAVLTFAGPHAGGDMPASHFVHHGTVGVHVMDSNAGGPT